MAKPKHLKLAPPTGKAGRPRLEFDLKLVETMGSIKASFEMMASVFGTDTMTISNRMANDDDFSSAYHKGLTNTRSRLIGRLIQGADEGNPVCLIFALKNLCGYADKQEHRHGGTEDGQPIKVQITHVDEVAQAKEVLDVD